MSAGASWPVRRRQLLLGGLGAVGGLLVRTTTGCTAPAADEPADELVLAGGPAGSTYLRQARQLARVLQERGAAERVRVVATEGSADNLALLERGAAHVGLSLVDAVVRSAWRPAALARSHGSLLQLLVRAGSPVTTLADLRGRRVSLGPEGSGGHLTGLDLLAGPDGTDRSGVVSRTLRDSAVAVAAGRLDGMLWWGGLPPADIASVDRHVPLRPLDLSGELARMALLRPGAYEPAVVPASAYGTLTATPTIGVGNLLVCRPDLRADVARAVVDACLTAAPELVPQPSDGVTHLARAALVDTEPVPLHEAAADAYRQAYG